MYYYLQESTPNWNERRQQERLRKLVGQFGIAGETVSPSPARTIDELVGIGLEKNYTTFVGVGSDLFLNKVTSSLINQRGRFGATRAVLGLVPTNFQSDIAVWLGYTSVDDAAFALKSRKVTTIDLPVIEPSKYFIAPLKIKGNKPFTIKLATSGYTLDAQADAVAIDRNLRVTISGQLSGGAMLNKLKQFFTGDAPLDRSVSKLNPHSLTIETLDNIPVYLYSEMVAKTPISLKVVPQVLNLIMERGSI